MRFSVHCPEFWPLFYSARATALVQAGTVLEAVTLPLTGVHHLCGEGREEPVRITRVVYTAVDHALEDLIGATGLVAPGAFEQELFRQLDGGPIRQGQPLTFLFFERAR